MRSFTVPAALSARGILLGGPFRFVLGGAAIGEWIADAQPEMPPRTAARGLTLRIAGSAAGGHALGGPRGAAVTVPLAVATAYAGAATRVALTERFGNRLLWGALEDGLAVALAA